ncbi:putative E3 ubiquitin-protein ligase RHY1A [Bidens hawaiensis]|uniref:putative E3 ubiquitin-protein ligase RHY1A n=1 Tax=Bidens hawaiensis TaxID=980011 RepID=UPI00404A45EC
MTSASELFYSRRYRSGGHNDVTITGLDSSFLSDSISSYRSTIPRHNNNNNRCLSDSRRIHRRRFHQLLEHQLVNPEEGGRIINPDSHRSIRTAHNRLPGSVLLARERLVERLRGVSVSGNSQRSGSSSTNTTAHRNDFSTRNVVETRRNKPMGLNEDEVKCLRLEAFSSESCSVSVECTICLEGFKDGDEIVSLLCTHRFHSCCLVPWVRVCGACPNCRKRVVVNVPVK